MPFAANVAACHLDLQSPEYFTDKVKVAVWDSTELDPDTKKSIPSVASTKYILKGQLSFESFLENTESKGVVSLTGRKPDEIPLERHDVVIMNPPFTRQERIPIKYKELLYERFKDYTDYLHGQLGYHGFFIFLADRPLKEDGKIALVLPATILRVKSCEGIRKLFSEKYHIEHIIVTSERSAFSESVRFREMLFVAKKKAPDNGLKTKITTLRQIPTTMLKARDIANTIKNATRDLEDDRLSIKFINYSELITNTQNWFKFLQVESFAGNFLKELEASEKLVTLRTLNLDIKRGVETARGGKIQALTINQPNRAIKSSDEWVIKEIKKKAITCENRFTHTRIDIPQRSLVPALRRVALIEQIDITGNTDYVLSSKFSRADEFFRRSLSKFEPTKGFWEKWETYVTDRVNRLAVVRRADISAPGTCLLSFYSKESFAPPGLAWTINSDDKTAKIMALWFNSTLSILQLIYKRKETRGAFLQLDKYVLKEFKTPDPSELSDEEVRELLETFESIRNTQWPSILEQLKSEHISRKKLIQFG